jgi:hypothetical protein
MESVVFDSFDVKGWVAVDYGQTGVVAVFDTKESGDEPELGKLALIIRPDGWMIRARMGEVKKQETAPCGVFFPKLTKQDVPIGSRIRWGKDFWPNDAKEELSAAGLQA